MFVVVLRGGGIANPSNVASLEQGNDQQSGYENHPTL
jgi:hypothetical protein